MLQSGIHATIAGVILAFCVPANIPKGTKFYIERIRNKLRHFPATVVTREDRNKPVVLSDEEIGVDIEEIRRFKPSLVDYTMNDAQRQMIAAAEHPEVEFIRLWTMKEALLKLTGLGLRTDLKTLDLSGYRFTTRVETQKGYVCTVCQK
jgi:phosphopantetheinyl transferase